MNLIVYTAPTSEPITLDEAKAHCRVTDDADDVYLATLIQTAREFVEAHTRRAVMTQTLKLTIPWWPERGIELARPPLQSVTSVTYTDENGTTQTLSTSLYTVLSGEEPSRIVRKYNTTWPTARTQEDSIVVTYVAGYTSAANVPAVIKQAMLLLIGHLYENREETTTGTISRVPMAVDSLLAKAAWGPP